MGNRYVVLMIGLLVGMTSAAYGDALDPIVLRSEEAPPGWTFIDEQRADDVGPVPEASAAVRQRWSYRGEPFALVYFLCADLDQATALYQRHVRTLGRSGVVAPLGPVVVEFLDAPSEVWPDAAQLLGLDAAQQRKLVPAALPKGWELADEFLSEAQTVAEFGAEVGAPVQALLVQKVASPFGHVRINYILCADRLGALKVYERFSPRDRRDAFVTLDGQVVIELVAEQPKALLPTLEVVEMTPLMKQDSGKPE